MSQSTETRNRHVNMRDIVLDVVGISFSYVDNKKTTRSVLRDVSLQLVPGEIVCLIGPSGCGKTTLLNLLAGLLTPGSGQIRHGAGGNGATASGATPAGGIGYIFQQDPLLPWRTVKQNLLLAAEIRRLKNAARKCMEQRMLAYLKSFHLSSEHLDLFPSQLSGGMRQRASIIQSLLFDPQTLLLDEPFSALDFFTKLRLETEFQQMVKTEKKAAIMVTHDIEEAVAMADRILLMNQDGVLCHQYSIRLGQTRVSPEEARGLPQFAEYYSRIWADLKTVMDQ